MGTPCSRGCGSVTKTFTTLLLVDMMERGQMQLDHPVESICLRLVKIPSRNGKEIALLHLAAHTSGLPTDPDNVDSQREYNPWADYTADKLYAFLSGYQLPRDPGGDDLNTPAWESPCLLRRSP